MLGLLAGLPACLEHPATHSSPPVGTAVSPRADTGPPAVLPATPEPVLVLRGRLRAGETLDGLLGRLRIDSALRHDIVRGLDGEVDVRRLRPGTGVAVVAREDGSIDAISIRPEPERFLRVDLRSAEPAAAWVDVPVRVEVRTAGGVVQSSVAQALAGETHARALVASYADIFQWDVDLFVDPRPGDVVRIVYEHRLLGEVPDDLPEYGRLPMKPGASLGIGRIVAASYDGAIARSEAYWVHDDSGDGDYYAPDGTPLRKAFLRSPLSYRRISSGFSRGRMHPVLRKVVPHHGVDFAARAGTPVVAAADGRVVSAGWDGALGKAVRLRHGNGYVTVYGHLRAFARGIRSGATVEQNQVVGFVGSTGRATGPHLHYSMLIHGRAVDPLRFDNPPVEALPEPLRPALARAVHVFDPVLHSVRPDADTAIAGSRSRARPSSSG